LVGVAGPCGCPVRLQDLYQRLAGINVPTDVLAAAGKPQALDKAEPVATLGVALTTMIVYDVRLNITAVHIQNV